MKTESEVKKEIKKIEKDIWDTNYFLENEVEFAVDKQNAIEDLIILEKQKSILKWVLD